MEIEMLRLHISFAGKEGVKTAEYILLPGKSADLGAFTACLTDIGGIYGIDIKAQKSIPLDGIDLMLALPDGFWDENLFFYDNMAYTNDITKIRNWNDYQTKQIRDVTVLHNKKSGEEFGIGLVTANRFYSELSFREKCVVVHTEMEGKSLHPGEEYHLERFIVNNSGESANAFLSRYASVVAELNQAIPLREVPVGWCSWSCFYRNVDEGKIGRAAKYTDEFLRGKDPNLLQIDDGWQRSGSFPGRYVVDEAKFPNGINLTAEQVQSRGMKFGLWLAPLLISEGSEYYEELKPMVNTTETVLYNDERAVHPFNYDNPDFYDFLFRSFSILTKKYGVCYYKLDFLAASFRQFVGDGKLIFSHSDYCVALFRKALNVIRKAVGEETVLVSCGSPLLEGAGIFNAARISCDVIWGKNKELPTYWEIMKGAAHTALYRSFYNQRVFRNDPDGIVLRDKETGDGFDCTYSEARFWATAVAVSGGSVLINEEMEKLSPARRSLFTDLVPPLGTSGIPCDFFETTASYSAVIPYKDSVHFAAVFYTGDTMDDSSFKTSQFGFDRALVVRCWDKTVLGVTDHVDEINRLPHSAELYLLYRVPEEPCFLYSDINVFGGVSIYMAHVQNNRWIITASEKAKTFEKASLYGWIPDGQNTVGEVVSKVPGGYVVRIA